MQFHNKYNLFVTCMGVTITSFQHLWLYVRSITCLNCSSKLQFCWEENSEEGVEWADPWPPRSPPGGVPPPDNDDRFVWFLLKLLSDRGIGPDPGNCGISGGKGGRRLEGIPRPSFPARRCERGDVRYSLLNASNPARPRGGGSLDAATARAAVANADAVSWIKSTHDRIRFTEDHYQLSLEL